MGHLDYRSLGMFCLFGVRLGITRREKGGKFNYGPMLLVADN